MHTVRSSKDVSQVRQVVRAAAKEAGMSLVELTKFVTATSELARNMWVHAGGGEVRWQTVRSSQGAPGFSATFEDQGEGIADLELAFTDGYTTGSGMGLGLSGSRRLVSEFDITTTPGQGTKIVITRWLRR